MTTPLSLLIMLLTLPVLAGCSLQRPVPLGGPAVESRPDTAGGITVFGDARLGIALD